jgi:exopolyphosphatase/guanosine-5'-triphosphate,3'-diphosphate pyrophosphatase
VGRNLAATGRIADGAFAALVAALDGFLAEIRARGARLVGAVATEAFRRASNGPALLERVSARLGMPCRILAGEEEARLAFRAVRDRHPLPDLAVVDIGAGSTEVTSAGGALSLSLGAVSLLEACGPSPEACRARALEAFRAALPEAGLPRDLVAVGGTASALAMLRLGLRAFDAAAIEGLSLARADVTAAIDRIAALPAAERAGLPGLDPGRAEIVVPGLCILESFLRSLGREDFRVSDRGIRYGVILEAEEGEARHGRV